MRIGDFTDFLQVLGFKGTAVFLMPEGRLLRFDPYFYEPWVSAVIAKPGWIVVDVGANVGFYTVKFSREVGKGGKVVAVEPHPGNYICLKETLSVNACKNVIPLNVALSNFEGSVSLHLSKYDCASHSAHRDFGGQTLQVRATTLDSMLLELDFNADLIKMIVVVEVHSPVRRDHEIHKLLRDTGFRVKVMSFMLVGRSKHFILAHRP